MSADLVVVAGAVAIVCGAYALAGWLGEVFGGKDWWDR